MNDSPLPLHEESDQELIARVRGGESAAYAVLWQRHAGPAYGVARSFASLDADDLVSEAFAKVLGAIRAGGGPTGAFRPYITMAVRNLGRSQYVREPTLVDTDFDRHGSDTLNGEVRAVESFESSVMLTAFEALPARWQEVLWFSEVDGYKPGVIARYLGIQPNAVSALLIRAKRGLKDAWVSAHLAKATTPDCARVIRDLGAYARGGLSARATAAVDAHLATCTSCPAALVEARHAFQLTLVLLPVVAGVAGAAGYAAQLGAPAVPQALVAMGVEPVEPVVEEEPERRRKGLLPAALLLLLLLVVGGGAALVLGNLATPPIAGEPVLAGSSPLASPTPRPTGTATPTPTPTPVATPDADTDADTDAVAPPASDDPTRSAAPPAGGPGAPGGNTEPSTGGGDQPSVEAPLAAPTATLTQADARMYPRVRGAGARPGASIQLVDEDGGVVGTGAARADGTWRAVITEGESGERSVRARQIFAGRTSPSSTAMTYTTTPPPALAAPLDGAVVSASSFTFAFTAPAGTVLQREIVGVTAVQTLRTPSSGAWNERVAVPVGAQTIRVRFANPATGDIGPWTAITVTAQ